MVIPPFLRRLMRLPVSSSLEYSEPESEGGVAARFLMLVVLPRFLNTTGWTSAMMCCRLYVCCERDVDGRMWYRWGVVCLEALDNDNVSCNCGVAWRYGSVADEKSHGNFDKTSTSEPDNTSLRGGYSDTFRM